MFTIRLVKGSDEVVYSVSEYSLNRDNETISFQAQDEPKTFKAGGPGGADLIVVKNLKDEFVDRLFG